MTLNLILHYTETIFPMLEVAVGLGKCPTFQIEVQMKDYIGTCLLLYILWFEIEIGIRCVKKNNKKFKFQLSEIDQDDATMFTINSVLSFSLKFRNNHNPNRLTSSSL
jgi:hypothetical protein